MEDNQNIFIFLLVCPLLLILGFYLCYLQLSQYLQSMEYNKNRNNKKNRKSKLK
jgi:predicted DNA repair protein MutK